ncbi:MAG: hypothetical protein AB1Z51_09340 [Desulfuromonadales bacterium]
MLDLMQLRSDRVAGKLTVAAWSGSRPDFSAMASFAQQVNFSYYREIIEIAQGLSAAGIIYTPIACNRFGLLVLLNKVM